MQNDFNKRIGKHEKSEYHKKNSRLTTQILQLYHAGAYRSVLGSRVHDNPAFTLREINTIDLRKQRRWCLSLVDVKEGFLCSSAEIVGIEKISSKYIGETLKRCVNRKAGPYLLH